MGEEVKPERMYEIKASWTIRIYLAEEIQSFCEIYFKPKERQSVGDHN